MVVASVAPGDRRCLVGVDTRNDGEAVVASVGDPRFEAGLRKGAGAGEIREMRSGIGMKRHVPGLVEGRRDRGERGDDSSGGGTGTGGTRSGDDTAVQAVVLELLARPTRGGAW